jgi:nitrile hydratase subunit beta
MNGPHDLGGAHGFGPVAPESNEPVFHADWEKRAFALVLAMGATGAWTLDMSRHARERIPPAEYLRSGYYEIWFAGLRRLLVERGLVSRDELASGRSVGPAKKPPRKATPETVPAMLAKGGPTERPAAAPKFKPGDRVRTKTMHPTGHTRLPRYVRGRVGHIERAYGAHVFPDASAAGRGEDPQWLYSVAFDASELWGSEGRAGDQVLLDLFEPYFEPA